MKFRKVFVENIGFFRLSEQSLSEADETVLQCTIPELQKSMQSYYGAVPSVYFVYPMEPCTPLRSVLLEFEADEMPPENRFIFKNVKLSPEEIHIVKKRFDELFAF